MKSTEEELTRRENRRILGWRKLSCRFSQILLMGVLPDLMFLWRLNLTHGMDTHKYTPTQRWCISSILSSIKCLYFSLHSTFLRLFDLGLSWSSLLVRFIPKEKGNIVRYKCHSASSFLAKLLPPLIFCNACFWVFVSLSLSFAHRLFFLFISVLSSA